MASNKYLLRYGVRAKRFDRTPMPRASLWRAYGSAHFHLFEGLYFNTVVRVFLVTFPAIAWRMTNSALFSASEVISALTIYMSKGAWETGFQAGLRAVNNVFFNVLEKTGIVRAHGQYRYLFLDIFSALLLTSFTFYFQWVISLLRACSLREISSTSLAKATARSYLSKIPKNHHRKKFQNHKGVVI